MHLFNRESFAACFHELDGRKAVGADGVTKAQYGSHLERNLGELVERMKRMAYRPGPVREVRIPKAGKPGAMRSLGISNLEDKLVQGVVQSSACSPVLANIVAHYVIDEWFEKTVKRHCAGEVALFRYGNDLVICCRYARDAERIRKALTGRLARFGLRLNEAKTRSVPFCRPDRDSRGRQPVTGHWKLTHFGQNF